MRYNFQLTVNDLYELSVLMTHNNISKLFLLISSQGDCKKSLEKLIDVLVELAKFAYQTAYDLI